MKLSIPLLCLASLAAGVSVLLNNPSRPVAAPKTTNVEEITYNEHIAPILNKSCVPCHRPGQAAPFSLIGYENAKQWSKMAALVTKEKVMPPWKAQPSDVEYFDANFLSDEQIEMIGKWAANGAPKGDGEEPAPPTFAKGWPLGEPDLIWKMPYEKTLSADGTDEYWNYVIKNTSTEPLYISAIDVKPGNREIVHHVIAFLDNAGRGEKLAKGKDGDGKLGYKSEGGGVGFIPSGAVGGWAPGATARKLPDGTAFKIDPGTDIILQIHYNKNGKVEKDLTEVAVYLADAKVEDEVKIAWIANPLIRIKANDASAEFRQVLTMPAAVRVYSVMPHMHMLGKAMKCTAIYPDGSSKVLIDVKDWDFNWQLIYAFKEPVDLPAGTKLKVEAVYDNTADNPNQPHDPPKTIFWGEKTSDEMMLLVATYSVIREGK